MGILIVKAIFTRELVELLQLADCSAISWKNFTKNYFTKKNFTKKKIGGSKVGVFLV
jgi:hypothetical protein